MPDRRDDAVTIAYVHANEVAHSWHRSLIDLVGWDLTHEQRVVRGGWLAIRCGTDGLPASRNEAASLFLAGKDAEWLWWIDTDMGFAPDTVDQLLAAADPVERPIVGGLCFAQREMDPDGMGGYRTGPGPTIYDWAEVGDQSGFAMRRQYEPDALVRCQATGSACILIHRSVLERVHDQFGTWYDRAPNPTTGKQFGEDISFCMRAGSLGIPIHVHTGVKTTHLKPIWLAEADFLATRDRQPEYAAGGTVAATGMTLVGPDDGVIVPGRTEDAEAV